MHRDLYKSDTFETVRRWRAASDARTEFGVTTSLRVALMRT